MRCLLVLATVICLASSAVASSQYTMTFSSAQIDITEHDYQQLQLLIQSNPYSKFTISSNKYNLNTKSIPILSRRYSLMRSLKIRKLMMQKGVQLNNIRVIVTTDTSKQNDVVTIYVTPIIPID